MTLKKIISIQGVGRFFDCPASGDVEFRRNTLIYGENGRGKTTFCAILRSLQTGESGHILGRKTLGKTTMPSVRLLLDGEVKQTDFDASGWTNPFDKWLIFDQSFITENVYTGDVIGTDQKRGLYRVIVGEDGVALAKSLGAINEELKQLQTTLKSALKVVEVQVPAGLTLKDLLSAPIDDGIDLRCQSAEKSLEAAKQSEALKRRDLFKILQLPDVFENLPLVLSASLETVSAEAERSVKEHRRKHAIKDQQWLEQGLSHNVDSGCPFCGTEDIADRDIVKAYKALFSDGYKALKGQIIKSGETFSKTFSDDALGVLDKIVEENRTAFEFWKQYEDVAAPDASLLVELHETAKTYRESVLRPLRQKAASPLEIVPLDADYGQAESSYRKIAEAVSIYNAACETANEKIIKLRAKLEATDIRVFEAEFRIADTLKRRHLPGLKDQCDALIAAKRDKVSKEKDRDALKDKLDSHSESVVAKYQKAINKYLRRFNAGFEICKIDHNYVGGVKADFAIRINNVEFAIGDERTPIDQPSFKNTLSAGDKSTLALAFFLAQLEEDKAAKAKVCVFDDPFTSQDSFRRNQTAIEVVRAGKACAQLIVLSHDASFLKLVQEQLPDEPIKALHLMPKGDNTHICPIDLDEFLASELRANIKIAQNFIEAGMGAPADVVQKIRPMLEGYYRAAYVMLFEPTDTLGAILSKIRAGGTDHPLSGAYDEIDDINQYTQKYHHGDGPVVELIQAEELRGVLRRALDIVVGFSLPKAE